MKRAHALSNAPVLAFALALAFTAASPRAHATVATDNACFASAVSGQKLRAAGKWVDARVAFLSCSKSSCPSEVSQDCTRWITELDAALPTVVFAARDDGRDVTDVTVFVDGAPSGSTDDGRPRSLDPGPHAIRFVRGGVTVLEENVIVRAGEKNRAITWNAPQKTREPERTAPSTSASTSASTDEAPAPATRSIPTGSYVAGGAGVVALGVFGFFGARGLSDYNAQHCGTGCTASQKDSVDGEFRVADVALAIGAVAIATAVVLYVVQPSSTKAAPHGALRAFEPLRF
jgi:hypothetical protein